MIKDNQKTLNRLHILLDAVIIVVSFLIAYYLRFYSFITNLKIFNVEKGTFYPLSVYAQSLYILVPLYLFIYNKAKLYTPKRGKKRWTEFYYITYSNFLGLAFYLFFLYMIKEENISRIFLGMFTSVNVIICTAARMSIAQFLIVMRRRGYNLKHVILVGYSRAAEAYIDRIFANPHWGYYIHGILDNNMEIGTKYKKVPVIGRLEQLEEYLVKMSLDEIAITISLKEFEQLEGIVSICEKSGVHTKFIPDYYSFVPTRPYTEDLYGLPVINIRNVPLTNTFNWVSKRIVDIIGSLVGLMICAVPMLIIAILIKLTSRGPIIFSQIRVGKHNKTFKMYKFRSMTLQTEEEEEKAWTTNNDPRVTRIGKFIRRTSIDELPQLFNILRGDMSLVGPRPERPQFVEKFKEIIPRYMIKHQVPPGLTGWAQINGYRGDTSITKRIEHDLYYIENWTLGFDFKIMFLTIFKGFINKNAY
ncbi:MAG: undecaprenyl-phosphate glucose phosphotransferase [Clostridiales bacterium]|nr:undecaprenyl-phosphate glucose phosphotransferase [Clostridiales bacterium]